MKKVIQSPYGISKPRIIHFVSLKIHWTISDTQYMERYHYKIDIWNNVWVTGDTDFLLRVKPFAINNFFLHVILCADRAHKPTNKFQYTEIRDTMHTCADAVAMDKMI